MKPFPQATFLKTIEQTIDDHQMINRADSVLAGVSGGPDSVALALSLLSVKKKFNITIGIAHVNHMFRGDEALRDEQFVRQFAKRLGLPFFCEQIDVKTMAKQQHLSFEEAGRNVRYDFFNRLSARHGYTKIATGHTRDDNSEAILMNLLRGSGPKGLCGIPPKRNHTFIRPLIRVSKELIIQFLSDQKQSFMIDASNTDMTYLRNKIRCDLIPRLQADYNPSITDALNRLSHLLTIEDNYMADQTKSAFSSCLIESDEMSVTLCLKNLQSLHPALQNRVIRKGIFWVKNNLKKISLIHLQGIIEFCFHAASGKSLDLPDRIRLYKFKDTIVVKKENQPLRDIGKQEKTIRQKIRKNQALKG